MTALEYMRREVYKLELRLRQAKMRGAPEEDIRHLEEKITYYWAAVDALLLQS